MTLPELYEQCRKKLPAVTLDNDAFEWHLRRAFLVWRAKCMKGGVPASCDSFLDGLYPLDLFLASACLEGDNAAWQALPSVTVGAKTLTDVLQARAGRLYSRDQERRKTAVSDFWGYLLASETAGTLAPLARYDGQRPLGPWLATVFRNWQITSKRKQQRVQALPEEDLELGRQGTRKVITRWNGRELPRKIDRFVEVPEDGAAPPKRIDAIQAYVPQEEIKSYLETWMKQRISAMQMLIDTCLGKSKLREDLTDNVEKICYGNRSRDERRTTQRLKAAVRASRSRREFFFTVLALGGAFAVEQLHFSAPVSLLTKEELQALLKYTSDLRLRNGDIVTCRQILDLAVENQLRCWKQGARRPADAEVLWDLLDHHFAVTLDSYDTMRVDKDLHEMESLLPLMRTKRPEAEGRHRQNRGRRHFHTDALRPAGEVAKQMVGGESPARFASQVLTANSHGDEFQAVMQVFEVGTFAGGAGDNDYCKALWDEAHRHCLAVGNDGGAARVLGRKLPKEAEDHRTDPGRARANAERLKLLPAEAPQIQNYPLWRIQNQLAVFRCFLIAGKDDDAMDLFEKLASEILRLGYRQGAVRLWRACRLAMKENMRVVLLSKAQAVMHACSLHL